MLNHQVEVIQMANCACNQATHNGRVIESLCLNPTCQKSTPLCYKCIDNHTQCRGQLKDLEAIPMELMGLRQLSLDIMVFQEQINQQFKDLLCQIELMLLPLSKYKDQPNFTNLNGIGFLLRNGIKQTILQSIEETKKQIKLILDNKTSNQQIKQKQELKLELEQQQKQKQSSENADSWYKKGLTLNCQSKYDESIECYNKAISIDPKHIKSWYSKGESLNWQRKYDEAIECYNKVISIDPKHIDSWYLKGYSLRCQGKYNESIECFNKAISIDPKHIDSWYWKGESLNWQRKYDEAIECYNKVISIDPKHIDSWYLKGESLEELGRLDEAIKSYEECNKIRPNYANSQLTEVNNKLKEKRK